MDTITDIRSVLEERGFIVDGKVPENIKQFIVKNIETTKEDRLLGTIIEMFYAAPALLHPLVRKCHDENYEIPADIRSILEKRGFVVDGKIPENIKQFIVKNIEIKGKNGISMTM